MSNSSTIVNNKRPRRDFHDIALLGIKAYNLAMTHLDEVDKRLPQGTLGDLQSNLVALGVAVPAARQGHIESEAATGVRNTRTEGACQLLTATRNAVRKAKAPRDVQLAYGLGRDIDARHPSAVRALIGAVLKRVSEHPSDLADYGIAKDDVAALQAAFDELTVATQDQQQKQAGAPLGTKERNILANRVLAAVQRISGAGELAFAKQPAIRAEFAAIHVTPPAKPKKKPAPAQPPAPPA